MVAYDAKKGEASAPNFAFTISWPPNGASHHCRAVGLRSFSSGAGSDGAPGRWCEPGPFPLPVAVRGVRRGPGRPGRSTPFGELAVQPVKAVAYPLATSHKVHTLCWVATARAEWSEPAEAFSGSDGLGTGAGSGFADRGRKIVADSTFRKM